MLLSSVQSAINKLNVARVNMTDKKDDKVSLVLGCCTSGGAKSISLSF